MYADECTSAVSTAKPKSDVEILMENAAKIPGPGAYKTDEIKMDHSPAVAFGEHDPPSDLDILIRRASQTVREMCRYGTIIVVFHMNLLTF